VLWCCWLGGRKGIRPVKNRVVVICLERGADVHLGQLMPLPLTVSCFSKIQIGFTFLVPAHLGSPGKRAVKRVCVCVCVCMRAVVVCSPMQVPTCMPITMSPARRRRQHGVAMSLNTVGSGSVYKNGMASVQSTVDWQWFRIRTRIGWNSTTTFNSGNCSCNCTAKHPNTKGTPQPYTSVQMLVQYNAIQNRPGVLTKC